MECNYISAIKKQDTILVWERDGNSRRLKKYPAPYELYVHPPADYEDSTDYVDMHGNPLIKLSFDNSKDFYNFTKECKSPIHQIPLFESDISPTLKVLSKYYYGRETPNLRVTFFDIENDYDLAKGYAKLDDPYAPINAISLFHNWNDTLIVLAVPPPGFETAQDIELQLQQIAAFMPGINYQIVFCEDERELLNRFLNEIYDSDVLSGWNSEYFDIPYICERLTRFYPKNWLAKMSFVGGDLPRKKVVLFNPKDANKFNSVDEAIASGSVRTLTSYMLSGRISGDYMLLFKKFEQEERPSYTLEAISEEFLPDMPKLEYPGSLASLYTTNFLWFLRYSIRDVEVLKGLDDILGYMQLSNELYHMSTGLFNHVTGTTKLAELSVMNYCHYDLKNVRIPDNKSDIVDGRIRGAFVLLPQVGEHYQIGSIDIKSLYPSSIRSGNISPEKLVGQFINKDADFHNIVSKSLIECTLIYEDGTQETMAGYQWYNELWERKCAISGFGTVFLQDKEGIFPAILRHWYEIRKKFQQLKEDAINNNDEIKTAFYNRMQYIYKIKLNSFYGALNNKHFKFFDLRMGESTTSIGREVLLHQCAKVAEILDGEYIKPNRSEIDKKGKTHIGYTNDTSIIYGDTDSTYFKTHTDTSSDAILVADRVGDLVSASFKEFMSRTFRCQPEFDDLISTEREIVSDRGIFVDKKRYMLHLVNKDGHDCDKMKVMGLDTKKTTLPKDVSKVLNNFLERYLKGEDWSSIQQDVVSYKNELLNVPDAKIYRIGLPKGVNNIEEYNAAINNDPDARAPGHVRAAIHWNNMLEKYNDKVSYPITSGSKLRVFYLRQSIGKFKSIALPVDIEELPEWFVRDFIPNIDRDAQVIRLVDNPLNNILKAIGKRSPSEQLIKVNNLFGMSL